MSTSRLIIGGSVGVAVCLTTAIGLASGVSSGVLPFEAASPWSALARTGLLVSVLVLLAGVLYDRPTPVDARPRTLPGLTTEPSWTDPVDRELDRLDRRL